MKSITYDIFVSLPQILYSLQQDSIMTSKQNIIFLKIICDLVAKQLLGTYIFHNIKIKVQNKKNSKNKTLQKCSPTERKQIVVLSFKNT